MMINKAGNLADPNSPAPLNPKKFYNKYNLIEKEAENSTFLKPLLPFFESASADKDSKNSKANSKKKSAQQNFESDTDSDQEKEENLEKLPTPFLFTPPSSIPPCSSPNIKTAYCLLKISNLKSIFNHVSTAIKEDTFRNESIPQIDKFDEKIGILLEFDLTREFSYFCPPPKMVSSFGLERVALVRSTPVFPP